MTGDIGPNGVMRPMQSVKYGRTKLYFTVIAYCNIDMFDGDLSDVYMNRVAL